MNPQNDPRWDESYVFAVCSFGAGLLGLLASLLCVGFLFAFASIVCGHMSQALMRRTGRRAGSSFALAGLIISYVHLLVYVAAATALVLLVVFGEQTS